MESQCRCLDYYIPKLFILKNVVLPIIQGHGEYTEIAEEKDFFEAAKKSANFVCHFYRDDFFRCKVVDKHLHLLARKHLETKFCKINAEKCPFLTGMRFID